MKIDPKLIKINPRIRQKSGEDRSELKKSIAERGLLNPICIDKDNNLLAGWRRLSCVLELGWSEVEVSIIAAENAVDKLQVEFEENNCRADFNDEERVEAIGQMNSLLFSTKPSWTIEKTANHLGIGKTTAVIFLMVYKERETELGKSEKFLAALKKSARDAYKLIVDAKEAHVKKLLAEKVQQAVKESLDNISDVEQETWVGGEGEEVEKIQKGDLLINSALLVDKLIKLGDSRELIKGVKDESIDFFFCDPPYGINIEEQRKEENAHKIKFDDSIEYTKEVLKVMTKEAFRVLKKDRYVFFWTSNDLLNWLGEELTAAGFSTMPVPFIWSKAKMGNRMNNAPEKWLTSIAEFAIVAAKGEAKLQIPGAVNLYDSSLERISIKIHPFQKPTDLNLHILQQFAHGGMTILDPFTGSGSILQAASQLGMIPLGFELNEDYYNAAKLDLISYFIGEDAEGLMLKQKGFTETQIDKMSPENKRLIEKHHLLPDDISVGPDKGVMHVFKKIE